LELLLVLGVLYGLQCFVWLAEGATLFVRPLRGFLVSEGPGWRLVHPVPSAPALLATRLPLVEQDGRWHGRAAPTWLSSRGFVERAPVDVASLADAEVEGCVVRVGGRPFARALAKEQAEPLARFLRGLAGGDAARARESLDHRLAESLSLERYRRCRSQLAEATRWLRGASDTYWVALFVGLPLAVLVWGGEPVLLRGALPVALLHLIALFAYWWAHRRLYPESRGERAESVFAAALYPPLLLRTHHELRTRVLADFHPAVVAVAALPRDAGRAFLRGEILRSTGQAAAHREAGAAPCVRELEIRALWALASQLGESRETLLAAPVRQDPRALAYCPLCHFEYAVATGSCADCGIALAPFEGAAEAPAQADPTPLVASE